MVDHGVPLHRDTSERIPVQLTAVDMVYAHEIARGRERHRRLNRVVTGREGFAGNLRGAMGEVAVAAHYGPEVAQLDLVYGAGDDGVDLIVHGKTVQVKAVWHFTNPLLMVDLGEELHAQLYMLVAVNTDTGYCHLVGMATRDQVAKAPRVRQAPDLPVNRRLEEHELRRFAPRA